MTFVTAAVLLVALGIPVAAGAPRPPRNEPAGFGPQNRPAPTNRTEVKTAAVSSAAPKPGGYFATLPPGARLPTGGECALRVHRSSWEPRPQNTAANHRVVPQPVKIPDNPAFDRSWQQTYKSRINGNFSGTTDEIIQWASCKWGISDDLTRARAVYESSWQQSKVGDFEARTSGHCAKDSAAATACPTSFGILQSKWYFRPGVYPDTKISTAFNVDSVLAETRGCLDGLAWFGPRSRGNVWGCVGLWFSGTWGRNDALYISHVRSILQSKPWLSWRG